MIYLEPEFLPRITQLERKTERSAEFLHVGVAYFLHLLKRQGFLAPSLVAEMKVLDKEYLRLGRLRLYVKTKEDKDALRMQEQKVERLRLQLEEKLKALDGGFRQLAGKIRTLQGQKEQELRSWRELVNETARRNRFSGKRAEEVYDTFNSFLGELAVFFETIAKRYEVFRKDLLSLLKETEASAGSNLEAAHQRAQAVEEELLGIITDAESEANKSARFKEMNRKVYLDLLAALHQSSIKAKVLPIELK